MSTGPATGSVPATPEPLQIGLLAFNDMLLLDLIGLRLRRQLRSTRKLRLALNRLDRCIVRQLLDVVPRILANHRKRRVLRVE